MSVQIIDLTLGFDLDLGLWHVKNGLDNDKGNCVFTNMPSHHKDNKFHVHQSQAQIEIHLMFT